jgi:hypothetical protein
MNGAVMPPNWDSLMTFQRILRPIVSLRILTTSISIPFSGQPKKALQAALILPPKRSQKLVRETRIRSKATCPQQVLIHSRKVIPARGVLR